MGFCIPYLITLILVLAIIFKAVRKEHKIETVEINFIY